MGQSAEIKILQRTAASYSKTSTPNQCFQNIAMFGERVCEPTNDSIRVAKRSSDR